jgi:hypothetical protein
MRKWIKTYENFTSVTKLNIKQIVTSYLEAALWTEEERIKEDEESEIHSMYGKPDDGDDDDDDEHVSKLIPRIDYIIDNIAIDSKIKAFNDIKKFISIVGLEIIDDIDPNSLGHDIWLSRNGHGAGFFDRGYDIDIEKKLMDAAHQIGEDNLYLGDDGLLHFEKE